MSKWQEKTKRPVLPVYMAALVWPIMALLVPIYTLGGLVLTAAVSAGAYFAGTKLCPTRVVRTYVPYATGSEDVDAMLNGIAANLDALHKLNEAIPDPQLSRAMDRMEKAGRSIAARCGENPRQGAQRGPLCPLLPARGRQADGHLRGAGARTASGARTPPRSRPSCAATPRRRRQPLKTSWMRSTAPRQWIFLPILRCWTVS